MRALTDPARTGAGGVTGCSRPSWRPAVVALAAGAAAAAAVAGAAARVSDAPPAVETLLGALFVLASVALAAVSLEAAAVFAIVELAVGGAGGRWLVFPGGIGGRVVLDAIVFAAAAVWLVRHRGEQWLGRYGPHAIAVAVVVPAVWVTLGWANGYGVRDAIDDGNGVAFLAFALVVVALVRRGRRRLCERAFVAACAANAALLSVFVVLGAGGLVSEDRLAEALVDDLSMGGTVGTMPNGAFRLYLGSGLYLQVGLVLATWLALRQPRRWWVWALMALLWFATVASYTRGYWIGALVAVVVTLVVGARHRAAMARVAFGTAAMIATGLLALSLTGSPIGRDLGARLGTGLAVPRVATPQETFPVDAGEVNDWTPGPAASVEFDATRARTGRGSWLVRVTATGRDTNLAYRAVVVGGGRHRVTGWVRLPRRWDGGRVVLGVEGVRLRPPAHVTPATPARAGEWQRVAFSFVPRERTSAGFVVLRPERVPSRGTSQSLDGVRADRGITFVTAPVLTGDGDDAGVQSNRMRAEQARVLLDRVAERPIAGYGFGAVAPEYRYHGGPAYELSYLHVLFKTGIVGFLLFFSFHARLFYDAVRARLGRRAPTIAYGRRDAAVPLALLASLGVTAATNPYVLAAFGIFPVLATLIWLEDDRGAPPV